VSNVRARDQSATGRNAPQPLRLRSSRQLVGRTDGEGDIVEVAIVINGHLGEVLGWPATRAVELVGREPAARARLRVKIWTHHESANKDHLENMMWTLLTIRRRRGRGGGEVLVLSRSSGSGEQAARTEAGEEADRTEVHYETVGHRRTNTAKFSDTAFLIGSCSPENISIASDLAPFA
jgi:hypothetical protein